LRFSNLRLSAKLLLMGAAWILAFMAFAVIAFTTLERLKVNGPIYADIIQGKDVVADVLPPPEYIIEAYLVTLQALDEADPVRRDALIARGRRLRAEYDERHAVWVAALDEGPLRHAMVETSFDAAMTFFAVRDEQLLPALAAGDRDRALALARGPLKDAYEAHRAAIDDVVRLASEQNLSEEAQAATDVDRGRITLVILGIVVVGLGGAIGLMTMQVANSLTSRIDTAAGIATRVASGDLTVQVVSTGDDEAGQLLAAIKNMADGLNTLVARVKQASIELMSTATEFSATSAQQETTVAGFGASTTEIAAAVKEISQTSQDLLATMEGVNHVASETAERAEQGRSGIAGMDATMKQLAQATGSISSKLATIREKAADINVVVVTITKVADQTNLLSVNAAIEAEKAGESGLGFLVVAREIRRLADQTAVATLNIEQMVRQMQSAVTAGVMEMDKFSEEVRRGVTSVDDINGQFARIIEQVQTLSARFDAVNEGMRSQSLGAKQINEAMVHLTDGARQTAGSLKEFNNATDHLRSAVGDLRREISHFKVSE
jgi:methyl-accepting chemotaxis protein WspA